MRLKIGLDLDDTVLFWWDAYVERFGLPKSDEIITRNVQKVLRKDKEFWLSLSVKHRPDFDVTLYCTKRVNNKKWTKEWLKNNGFQDAPVYQVYTQARNKADLIKGRIDVFIDDSVFNYNQLNKAGVPCLLMDSPANRNFETPYRVHSLNYNEIKKVYETYKRDLGSN